MVTDIHSRPWIPPSIHTAGLFPLAVSLEVICNNQKHEQSTYHFPLNQVSLTFDISSYARPSIFPVVMMVSLRCVIRNAGGRCGADFSRRKFTIYPFEEFHSDNHPPTAGDEASSRQRAIYFPNNTLSTPRPCCENFSTKACLCDFQAISFLSIFLEIIMRMWHPPHPQGDPLLPLRKIRFPLTNVRNPLLQWNSNNQNVLKFAQIA